MTLDNPDDAASTDDNQAESPPAATAKLMIYVTPAGGFDPTDYAAVAGAPCTVAPVAGTEFVGDVEVKDRTGTVVATWAVNPRWEYTLPTTLGIYTLSTGVIAAGVGTINIGSRPPMAPKDPVSTKPGGRGR